MQHWWTKSAFALVIGAVALPQFAQTQQMASGQTGVAAVATALQRANDDIIFQDRYEAEIVQVPSQTAELIVAPNELPADPNHIAALNDQAVFTLSQFSNREVWFADGSDGGTYAIELSEGYEDVTVRGHVVLDDRLYFFASPSFGVTDIWATDGTEDGTVQVVDGAALGFSQSIEELTTFGSRIAFRVYHDGEHRVFLLDDAVAGGALAVDGLRVYTNSPRALTAVDGELYVSGWLDDVGGLHRVDADGAANLAWELEPMGSMNPILPQHVTTSGNSVFFAASQGTGVTLWRHVPNEATLQLFDPSEDAEEMRGAANLTVAGDRVFFFTLPWNPDAEDFTSAWRVAVSDGSVDGTYWYWPPLSESGLTNAQNFPTAAVGNRMMFRSQMTDGTADGTGVIEFDGTSIWPDHSEPGVDGVWITATNGRAMVFAGFDHDDSFLVSDPDNLWYNNNGTNLAMVDGLPWMIARIGFGSWGIWRMAPEEAVQ